MPQMEYLGNGISEKGIESNQAKGKAMPKFPFPISLKAVTSFLGMVTYYREVYTWVF